MQAKRNGPRRFTDEERIEAFWSKVDRSGPDGCWLWSASLDGRGYGQFGVYRCGKHCIARAHRFSWELAWGPIPVGMMVLHRCDVRRCVRPDHLFLGTAEENTADMMAKGRMGPRGLAKGERIGIARLTADAVEVIRSRSHRGATRASLARELNVSETTILDVVRGRTWKHVPSAAAHKRTAPAPQPDLYGSKMEVAR